MTPYQEVKYLDQYGTWPNGVPEWAAKFAEQYGVNPTSNIICIHAYKQEIERLRDGLKQARACLMDLPGPVATQMQKMITVLLEE